VSLTDKHLKNIAGVSLIELLIGICVTALMMGALFSTYTVVNNSYNQVVDKASVSRSSRDLVGMMVKDIRLAGFKYYYGENTEDIPAFENLTHISGTEEGRDLIDSHDPLIVERNILGYIPADGVETIVRVDEETTDSEASDTIDVTTNISGICCDRISVVYGDFDKRDPKQKYKKYRITYFADRMNSQTDEKLFALYKTKECWVEHPDAPKGDWFTSPEECYPAQLVRTHLVDMEFLLFDSNGKHLFNETTQTYPLPINESSTDLYRIRQVDMRLTFRSKKDFYAMAGSSTKPRLVKGLTEERTQEFVDDKYLRDSVVVSIFTRNIGIN